MLDSGRRWIRQPKRQVSHRVAVQSSGVGGSAAVGGLPHRHVPRRVRGHRRQHPFQRLRGDLSSRADVSAGGGVRLRQRQGLRCAVAVPLFHGEGGQSAGWGVCCCRSYTRLNARTHALTHSRTHALTHSLTPLTPLTHSLGV